MIGIVRRGCIIWINFPLVNVKVKIEYKWVNASRYVYARSDNRGRKPQLFYLASYGEVVLDVLIIAVAVHSPRSVRRWATSNLETSREISQQLMIYCSGNIIIPIVSSRFIAYSTAVIKQCTVRMQLYPSTLDKVGIECTTIPSVECSNDRSKLLILSHTLLNQHIRLLLHSASFLY